MAKKKSQPRVWQGQRYSEGMTPIRGDKKKRKALIAERDALVDLVERVETLDAKAYRDHAEAQPKQMLYDKLQVALADPKRRLKDQWNEADPHARAQLHLLSQKLVKAVRFELDADFTAMASDLSLIEPRKLAYLYSSARAPYDLTWIEWSPVDRARGSRQRHDREGWAYGPEELEKNAELDSRAGMLFERDTRWPDRDSVYRVSVFASGAKEGELMGWPVGIIYDPNGHSVDEQMSNFDLIADGALGTDENWRMLYALGPGWLTKHGAMIGTEDDGRKVYTFGQQHRMALRYIQASARYTANGAFGMQWVDGVIPYLAASYKETLKEQPGLISKSMEWIHANRPQLIKMLKQAPTLTDAERFRTVVETTATEGAGDLRWTATLLGLINTYETIAGPSQQIEGAKLGRVINLKKTPYLEYRRLSVVLPKGKHPEYRIKQLTNSMIRHRAHMVRGFYRTYKATSQRAAKRVWVHSHQRGDASIGWVVKSYHVEKNPNEGEPT